MNGAGCSGKFLGTRRITLSGRPVPPLPPRSPSAPALARRHCHRRAPAARLPPPQHLQQCCPPPHRSNQNSYQRQRSTSVTTTTKVSDTSSLSDMAVLSTSKLLATLLLVAAASAPPAAAQSARTGAGGTLRDPLPAAVAQQPARRGTPPSQPRGSQTPAVTGRPLVPTPSPAPRDPVVPTSYRSVGRTDVEPASTARIPKEPAFRVASRYKEVPAAVARDAADPVSAAQPLKGSSEAGSYCLTLVHFFTSQLNLSRCATQNAP